MGDKVLLAILDKDLKARTFKEFNLSSEGSKIDVVNAGKGYFMPKINNDTFLELPRPWYKGGGWQRIYVAIKGSDSCINFRTGVVDGPDPKQVIEAAKSELVRNFGKEEKNTPWWVYLLLVINIFVLMKMMGVIV